jgi:UDP-galactopyranose mutase
VKKFLIIGAGFAGSICARQLADAGHQIKIVDRRPHIGGNAFDKLDEHGVLVHPYGPHIFHTNSKRVFEYLSNFTNWRFYEHRVLAKVGSQFLPIPINRTTINALYDLNLTESEVDEYLAKVKVPRSPISSSEDVVLNSVGYDLCEKFFRGYTKKQWGLDLSELSAGVAARIPTRTNDDDRYFADTFQFMPDLGYTSMFEKILAHPSIEVCLQTDYKQLSADAAWDHVICTGPIDAYFDHRYGKLPYRSLQFQHEHLAEIDQLQQVGTVNYPNDYDYTRITEFKHLTGQHITGTSIVREFPCDEGDPYYPIPRAENEDLYKRYAELAATHDNVTFVGRLAQYRYYNMDQIAGAALKASEDIIARFK